MRDRTSGRRITEAHGQGGLDTDCSGSCRILVQPTRDDGIKHGGSPSEVGHGVLNLSKPTPSTKSCFLFSFLSERPTNPSLSWG